STLAPSRRRSATAPSSGMRFGLCTALIRLWIRLVMNTVLPARDRPVTASGTVEPGVIRSSGEGRVIIERPGGAAWPSYRGCRPCCARACRGACQRLRLAFCRHLLDDPPLGQPQLGLVLGQCQRGEVTRGHERVLVGGHELQRAQSARVLVADI